MSPVGLWSVEFGLQDISIMEWSVLIIYDYKSNIYNIRIFYYKINIHLPKKMQTRSFGESITTIYWKMQKTYLAVQQNTEQVNKKNTTIKTNTGPSQQFSP